MGRDGRKGRAGAGPKEGGGKDGEQERRRKGARAGRQKKKILEERDGVPRVWALYWNQSGRSLTGPRMSLPQPHNLPRRPPDQEHVEAEASPEATSGLVEKEGNQ